MTLDIKQIGDALQLPVKVVPGSSASRIAGEHDGALKINIAAAPAKGKANKELIAFLAKKLKIAKSAITIVAGEHDTRKQLRFHSLTKQQLRQIIKT